MTDTSTRVHSAQSLIT